MASNYPTALDTFATNKTDATATAGDHAAAHNDNASAINNIEAELGINPSGTFSTVVARLAATQTVRKTADQTQGTTTLTNVSELLFPVTVGADHFVEFFIWVDTATTGNAPKFAVTWPALGAGGFGSFAYEYFYQTAPATGGTDMVWDQVINTSGTGALGVTGGTVAPVAGTPSLARLTGLVTNPSASGNIQLQVASEAAVNVIVKKGSFGRMTVN